MSSPRRPSKKQPALCAPPVTESNMDTALGSTGAFSFLVMPVSRPLHHGGSCQSSPPRFLLTACLLWPCPTSRAQALPKGDFFVFLPVKMQLFYCSIRPSPLIPFKALLNSFDLHTFYPLLYYSVHCVQGMVYTFN